MLLKTEQKHKSVKDYDFGSQFHKKMYGTEANSERFKATTVMRNIHNPQQSRSSE